MESVDKLKKRNHNLGRLWLSRMLFFVEKFVIHRNNRCGDIKCP